MEQFSKNSLKGECVYWITGQSGAGKTTLASALQAEIGGIVLDGNKMRESISLDLGFSKKDRETHNLRVARLASVLSRQSSVIVSVIAPFESTRKKIDKLINPLWIYVARHLPEDSKKPYEIPDKPHIVVNSDTQTTSEQVKMVTNYIKEIS